MLIDWLTIADKVGAHTGGIVYGGSDYGKSAIVELLGEQAILEAVRDYVRYHQARELIRSVLGIIRPRIAAVECLRLYQTDTDIETRRAAVDLLRVVATPENLADVWTLWSDPDDSIQALGASVLEEVAVLAGVDSDELQRLMDAGVAHLNPTVNRLTKDLVESLGRSS